MKTFPPAASRAVGVGVAAAIVMVALPAPASAAPFAPSNARYGGTTNQLSPFQKNPEAAAVKVSRDGRKLDIATRERLTCQSGETRNISGWAD